MAEVNDAQPDHTTAGAAAAIEALLSATPPSQDVNGNDVAPSSAAPAPTQDSPPAPSQDAAPGNTADQGLAPAVEAPQPTPQPAKVETPPSAAPDPEAARLRQEAETARNNLTAELNAIRQQRMAAFTAKFPDIKTQDDMFDLGDPTSPKYDPAKYNAATIELGRIQAADNRIAALQNQARAENDSKMAAWRKEQEAKMGELIPELKDPEKGKDLSQRILKFAAERGYTPQQLQQASASDTLLLYQAMQFVEGKSTAEKQAAEAAKALADAKAKAAKAPPVQTPGTTPERSAKDERVQENFARLQKSGRTDDAAAVLYNILN